jgi:hypothetical protein
MLKRFKREHIKREKKTKESNKNNIKHISKKKSIKIIIKKNNRKRKTGSLFYQ